MNVTSDIRRSDLFYLNLYVYPRTRSTYVFFGVLVLVPLIVAPIAHDDFMPKDLAFGLLLGMCLGIVGVLVKFLISVAVQLVLVSQSKNTGALGVRTYTLRDDGFEWDGEASSGKQKWMAIRSVIKTKEYILISITPRLFFVVPRRSFSSGEAFMAFFDHALTLWKKSHQ